MDRKLGEKILEVNQDDKLKRLYQKVLWMVLMAVIYYYSAQGILNWVFKSSNVCLIWFPSGVALAGFLLLGEWIWAGIWLGIFLLEIHSFSSYHLSWSAILLSSAVMASVNVIEGVVASWAIKHFIRWKEFFEHVEHVPEFMLIVSLSCAISASVGLAVLNFNDLINLKVSGGLWLSWWLANIGGMLIVLPCILAFTPQVQRHKTLPRIVESIIFFLCLLIIGHFTFTHDSYLGSRHVPTNFPIFLLIIWAASRLGPKRVTVAVFIIFIQVVLGYVHGTEVLGRNGYDAQVSFILEQIFLLSVSLVGMVFMTLTAERVFVQQELQNSQKRFKALVENNSDIILVLSAEGVVTYSSPSIEKVLGYTQQEHEGQIIFDFIHPEDLPEILNKFSFLLSNPWQLVKANVRIKHKNGSWIWVEGCGDNLLADAAIRGIIVNYRDITDRKLAQERFEQVVELAPNAMIIVNKEGQIQMANKAAEALFGYKKEELLNLKVEDLIPQSYRDGHVRQRESYGQSPHARPMEIGRDFYGLRKNGSKVAVEIGLNPMQTEKGIYILASIVDITQRRLAEDVLKRDKESLEKLVKERSKELLKIQNELKDANRLADIGTLAAIVAHELRTPLGVIQMASHNLRNKNKELSQSKHLENIEKKVWEGNRIIDNLLSYSRIKMPTFESCVIVDLFEECLLNVRNHFKEQQLTINIDYHIDRMFSIDTDVIQIKAVLVNILNNACQALEGKDGKIRVSVKEEGEYLQIKIKDNGEGIDPQYLDKIFQPFFTTKAKGTGLGLALCNEVINLHRGRLEIQSVKGQGADVLILVPVRQNITIKTEED
ncbi:MAG: PAS domain S-box protein [Candidatus Omnitrophica bacterium]|nr:PAS domain S-box protein [Candidatus Omnitrophota bacterium]